VGQQGFERTFLASALNKLVTVCDLVGGWTGRVTAKVMALCSVVRWKCRWRFELLLHPGLTSNIAWYFQIEDHFNFFESKKVFYVLWTVHLDVGAWGSVVVKGPGVA
jgi:hypothetical protein